MSKILDLDLAFESYEDDTHDSNPLLDKICGDIKYLRQNKQELNEIEKIKLSQKILDNFEQLLDIVGRDKFYFYDDGGIEYKWGEDKEENHG